MMGGAFCEDCFVTLQICYIITCVVIFVKNLIKTKCWCGRIDTRYNWLEDVKLRVRYQAVVAVVGVASMTTDVLLISSSLVNLYYWNCSGVRGSIILSSRGAYWPALVGIIRNTYVHCMDNTQNFKC